MNIRKKTGKNLGINQEGIRNMNQEGTRKGKGRNQEGIRKESGRNQKGIREESGRNQGGIRRN